MSSNRRIGTRNRFEFKRNYIIPLVCIIITCISIITCTVIVINVKNEANNFAVNTNTNIVQSSEELKSEEKIQINSLISYIMSNLDAGKSLNDSFSKFTLTCKYYGIDNNYSIIPNEHINKVDAELYRELNYVYFADYKEEYKYIKKADFENTYNKLFSKQTFDASNYSKYYIDSLDGYLVPKNTDVYENVAYKLDKIQKNSDDKYIANFAEVNMYKLYEGKTIDEIDSYLASDKIDSNFTTGNVLNVYLVKQQDIFVFDSYTM